MRASELNRPNQPRLGASIGAKQFDKSAIAFRSIRARSLSAHGSSGTLIQHTGIAPMKVDTRASQARSASRIAGDAFSTSGGEVPTAQVATDFPSFANNAVPTWRRKIEPRWLPVPLRPPRCCLSRPCSVDRDPRLTACVPTRTTRGTRLAVRCSPASKKKYTPRAGTAERRGSSLNVPPRPGSCLRRSISP